MRATICAAFDGLGLGGTIGVGVTAAAVAARQPDDWLPGATNVAAGAATPSADRTVGGWFGS